MGLVTFFLENGFSSFATWKCCSPRGVGKCTSARPRGVDFPDALSYVSQRMVVVIVIVIVIFDPIDKVVVP